MSEAPDISGMTPGEAYRIGFSEAQTRAEAIAQRIQGGSITAGDGPFTRGQKLAAAGIASAVAVMQPGRF